MSGTRGGSQRYRCHHRVEQLALAGIEARVVDTDAWDERAAIAGYDAFILHRVGWRKKLPWFLRESRRLRKPTLYETDDLTFDVESAALRQPPAGSTVDELQGKHERQRLTLARSDGATVSTAPLAGHARRANELVAVVPNVVSRAMVAAGEAAAAARADGGPVTLGYFSGTATHDADFAEIAEPVLHILRERPASELLVVGPLHLDGRFDAFAERVRRVEEVAWQELPQLIASVDVNLAPLESGNVFAESKSCVKLLEAALVEVPTIASPIPDFRRVVRDSENGLLAATDEEWASGLRRLVDDGELRRRLGKTAADDVRRDETTDARAGELASTLAELLAAARPGPVSAATARASSAARRGKQRLFRR